MQFLKIECSFKNYEEEINRIIKEMQKKNMYLKEAYLENKAIVLSFSKNENAICKKKIIAIQGKLERYKDKYDFIKAQIHSRRSFRENRYTSWSVITCLEFDGKYLIFISRKRKGYHKKKG